MEPEQQTILIVDDNANNRDLLTRYMRRLGHAVVIAPDGGIALDLLRNQPVDLMLLDIMMPDVNGYQVLEVIKADPLLRHIPVIVISALSEFDSVIKCIDLGAEDYLTKPFNATLLNARISASLEKKRLRDQEQSHLEELLVTQRIDRELNASLDVGRAMAITLDWALRRSGADAGFIGVVEAEGIRVMAARGYSDASSVTEHSRLPCNLSAFQVAIATGHPQVQRAAHPVQNGDGFFSGSQCQAIIPVRREDTVIGLLVLENHVERKCTEEIMSFLLRLTDHAAIAIANAQLYAALEHANAAKNEFIAFATHELKTPMTAIRGYADILLNGIAGSVNPSQAEFLTAIRVNVDLMSTLVSDLADIARIESGHLHLEWAAIPIHAVVAAALQSTRSQIAVREQKLLLDVPATLPPVWGDYTRLTQIISNLVSNAYKYTPHGGEIYIHAQHIPAHTEMGTHHEGDVVRLAVQDSGYGIPLEDQPQIFHKFFRGRGQATAHIPGTGLGLHITRHLVELQGGRIWFSSAPGEGTTFSFTIPVAQVAQDLPEQMVEVEA